MTNDNLIIAAVVGVLALLASGVVAAGGRASDALPTGDDTPSSGPELVATANGYRIEQTPDGRFAVVGTSGTIGTFSSRGGARSVANQQPRNSGGFGTIAGTPDLAPAVVNENTYGGGATETSSAPSGGSDPMPNQQGPGDGRAGGVDDAPNIPDAGEGSETGLDDTLDADTSSGSFLRSAGQSVDDYRAEFTENLLSDDLINSVRGD